MSNLSEHHMPSGSFNIPPQWQVTSAKPNTPKIVTHLTPQGLRLLRTPSKPITDLKQAAQVAEWLKNTLLDAANQVGIEGVGLSAIQIGIPLQIFVAEINGVLEVFINPKIKPTSPQKEIDTEGCLSLPNIIVPVPRYKKIIVKYTTLQGTKTQKVLKGFNARVVQHEFDHLQGKLITDYALYPSQIKKASTTVTS